MANGPLLRAALLDTGDTDGDGFELEQGRGRDGADIVHGSGVLFAAPPSFDFRPGYGAALSFVCHINAGSEYAREVEFRDGSCAYSSGVFDEFSQHNSSRAFQEKEAMVAETVIKTVNLKCSFGEATALTNLNIEIRANEILGIIGPSNSGKTTFLRALNRLNYLNTSYRQSGEIIFEGKDISQLSDSVLRKKIGIIFALPQVLPISIFHNVAYGPKVHGVKDKSKVTEMVEKALKKAYLWDEVKDRLDLSAMRLSGGQQQRLCIARTLAVEPDVILYDEPCSGLDPISTAKVEDAMRELKKDYTQILVTNNTKQAARVSERCGFFLMGDLVEIDETKTMFTNPKDKRTDDYITGRFG
jgi:phosphate transport system ATP-binding protein